MRIIGTDEDTQEAINLAHGLFDDGHPFVDSDGTHYYGQAAKDKLGELHLAGQGCIGILALPLLALLMLAVLL